MDRTPAGFLSYARFDDEYEEGYLTSLRERLEKEVRLFTGEDFSIFQDRVDVRWGQEWAGRIGQAIHSVSFLLPVMTPSLFKSDYCRRELEEFVKLEQETGRRDLILPLYYVDCLDLEKPERLAAHPWARHLASRQYVDWRDLRSESFRDPRTRARLASMAVQIRDAMERAREATPPSPTTVQAKSPAEIDSSARDAEGGPFFYEDFVLQITRSPEGDYVLRVLQSPAGEAEARLEQGYALQEIETTTRIYRKQDLRPGRSGGQELEKLGERLHHLLMPPSIAALFSRSLDALGPGRGLRLSLRLGLEDPTVAPFWSLPWEYLYLPKIGSFLGLSRQCLLVRRFDLPLPSFPPVRVVPLRLLMVASDPYGGILDLEEEIASIERALAGTSVEVAVLRNGTRADLRRALLDHEFHIVHLMGDGKLDDQGEGNLFFSDRAGDAQLVSGRELARDLAGFPSLRLAVINVPESGRIAPQDPTGSVATALLRAGLPAVVGYQGPLSDRAAIAFSQAFYGRLAHGDPVDLAVLEGRHAIRHLGPESPEWSTPVLFVRSPDQRLFQVLPEGDE